MVAPTDADALVKRPLYVYDLPPELLATLEFKAAAAADAIGASISLDPVPETERAPSPPQDGPAKATSCALCSLSFPTVVEQRSHVRSDLHAYNLKQKMRGRKPVLEAEFEKMMGDLDESLSGSESSASSGSDFEDFESASNNKSRGPANMLSALLKKNATIADEEELPVRKKRGAGKPPLLWFTSQNLPKNTNLGVWRALFTHEEQTSGDLVAHLRAKQLAAQTPPKPPAALEGGGVSLPKAPDVGPHIFLCMIGGGHFAGMVVALSPKRTKKQGAPEERHASVIAHKTFHRYTTRRKQGGSQAANDSSKGAAHSAGSSLRRYNEEALTKEVRELMAEWKELIDTASLLFIRATGTTNRRTLFGPYEGQVLSSNDPRNRGFPFSTRRATQAELMRCFVELTRVKVTVVDEEALAAQRRREADEAAASAAQKLEKETKAREQKEQKKQLSAAEEEGLLHTSQIEALIRRTKAPALLSYLTSNDLSADFELQPKDSPAHHHASFPLHMAASVNAPALVSALLTKGGADPTKLSGDGKTAFEVAGDRATRDAFRLARSELGSKWDWDAARIPDALTKAEVEDRARREKAEDAAKEQERRAGELERLKEDERRKEEERAQAGDARRERKMGKGHVLKTAEEAREEETRGMTPEMRMRLERERRARAMEARMGKK